LETKNIIPFTGIKRQYQYLREEVIHITDQVYSSGQVLDGEYTRKFEQAIANRCDRQFAIAVNSCTQGLVFALQAVYPTGRVLIPTLSFAATLNSVLMTEHTPEFVDVDSQGLMDLKSVNYSLHSERVAVVMYVNLFGNTVDYDQFRMLTEFWGSKPAIIEDAAQSFGASYRGIPSGKMGDVSVLSFDPTKNLPNYGSGGMILTDDAFMAESFVDLRDNGKKSHHEFPGTNSKMSEVDCAQMLVKLQYFDTWQQRRADIAQYYTDQFGQYVDIIGPSKDVVPSWHKFVIRIQSQRSRLQHCLSIAGIETKVHYAEPLDLLSVGGAYAKGMYPGSLAFSRECLSLPIYPELTDSEVEHVASSVREFLTNT
jgi:dTDP-4-amino-4,6-dideoxygalactose transaminase